MARSELESVINLCRMVQAGSIEPFDIDFDYVLSVIRKHYPKIKTVQELCLDAEALKELSAVLERQNEWISHQSSTLYKDPFMLHQQLMAMDISAIAQAFLKSWHPLLEMEQLTARTLAGSIGYWGDLIPMDERWKEPEYSMVDPGVATRRQAYELGLLPEEGFREILEGLWRELGERTGPGGQIEYWEWVGADTYEETVRRAYLTCFMVSYGYANVEMNRLTEVTEIIHHVEPRLDPGAAKVSLPILIDREEWERWRRE